MNLSNHPLTARKAIKVIYVSSYIPEKCGIATFTKDLTNAINLINPYALAEIMVTSKTDDNLDYPWEVKFKIDRYDLNSYLQAAEYINNSSADMVVIEHEFGLFGGPQGEYLIPLVEALKKPYVVTCHTVRENPDDEYGPTFKRLLAKSAAITVMMEQSAEKLINLYQIPQDKICVIPHGTPDLPYAPSSVGKRKKRLANRVILGNINLIAANKGLEYTIEAVAEIAKIIPNILYIIVGQTHPSLLKTEGEKYRNFLKKKIRQLGIKDNVRFINRYVSLPELLDWLKCFDFYVTPYLDAQQASSGALAYAIGAGKLCISTPYLYAKEALDDNRGVIVPFHNSAAIAKAVTTLWQNQEKMDTIRRQAYQYGRLMTWHSVALQHLDLFKSVLKNSQNVPCPDQ